MITLNEVRALLDTTGLEYKITERGDWYEVETFKHGSLAWRLRSFEPDFEVTLRHDCRNEAEKYRNEQEHRPVSTTTYTLTGNNGTLITVTVEHTDNNAVFTHMYILAANDDAPEYFVDALTIEEDFIIAKCFDGGATDGDQWALALDDDGQLTHENMAFNPQYVETFTINVKEA